MNIYYPELDTSRSHVRNYLDKAPANLSDVLQEEFFGAAAFGVNALNTVGAKIESAFQSDVLSEEEYKQSQFYRQGVEVPKGGIKVGIAKVIAENYDKRQLRNQTLDRARQTIGTGAARFGASLVGSIFDPVNVALGVAAPMMIGANATARAASARAVSGITTKYGVSAGRVAAGVGEGALGAVAFEPLALYSSTIAQDPEYGLFDTFVNITAGAAFGGILTGVGGKFSDKIRTARIDTQRQAIRSSIAQTMEGRTVDVDEPIVSKDTKLDEVARMEEQLKAERQYRELTRPLQAKGKKINRYFEEIRRAFVGRKNGEPKKPETLLSFVRKQKIATEETMSGEVKDIFDKGAFGFQASQEKGGLMLDELALKAQEAGFLLPDEPNGRVTIQQLLDALDSSMRGEDIYSQFDPDAVSYVTAVELMERADAVGLDDPIDMSREEFFEELDRREGALDDETQLDAEPVRETGLTDAEAEQLIVKTSPDPDDPSTYADYFDDAAELEEFEKLRSGEMQEADAARFATKDSEQSALDTDIQRLTKQVQALRDNDLISDEDLIELEELDSMIEQYENIEEATNAGAACLIGA